MLKKEGGLSMNDIKITANIEQIKHLGNLFNGIQELIHQIEIAEFKDENGHELKHNDVYREVRWAMRELTDKKEHKPQNITVNIPEVTTKIDSNEIAKVVERDIRQAIKGAL